MMIRDFEGFISQLDKKLKKPLPGISSQLKMASMRRLIEGGKAVVPSDSKKAGVLVLFYPVDGHPYIVFIKRNEYPGVHSGQISFPGGGYEIKDKNLVNTALRESEEEIGVLRNLVRTMGQLSDLYIPPSHFLVTPVVGYTSVRPEFRPEPSEVQQILEIPLASFLDPNNLTEKEIILSPGSRFNAPCYYVDENIIWGATAMILHEMIDVIN